jgi:hypothetical protein
MYPAKLFYPTSKLVVITTLSFVSCLLFLLRLLHHPTLGTVPHPCVTLPTRQPISKPRRNLKTVSPASCQLILSPQLPWVSFQISMRVSCFRLLIFLPNYSHFHPSILTTLKDAAWIVGVRAVENLMLDWCFSVEDVLGMLGESDVCEGICANLTPQDKGSTGAPDCEVKTIHGI